VSKIYSVAGLLPKNQPLITQRPFRLIHHTASAMSIVGGGNIPGPGEASLAHRGVLFLDEMAEFPKQSLEVLRQPLEDRFITVSRVSGTYVYPCQFTLVAAMNPCPCGYRNVEDSKKICNCTPCDVKRYEKRISGPFMDRIDLFVNVKPVDHNKLIHGKYEESSETIRQRVESAAKIQRERFKGSKTKCNAEIGNRDIERFCPIGGEAQRMLSSAVDQMGLSARGYFRILKVARTIADLGQKEKIEIMEVAEALQYRNRTV
jgi:magnesium chelatase family protein